MRKNLLGLKHTAINIYFAFILPVLQIGMQHLIFYLSYKSCWRPGMDNSSPCYDDARQSWMDVWMSKVLHFLLLICKLILHTDFRFVVMVTTDIYSHLYIFSICNHLIFSFHNETKSGPTWSGSSKSAAWDMIWRQTNSGGKLFLFVLRNQLLNLF